MLTKPEKFSFYDVRNIPESLMNFDYITAVTYDDATEEVSVTYRSGVILNLGSVAPGQSVSLASAALNTEGELVFTLDNGSTINIGKVVSEYIYEDSYVSGTGLLTSQPGVYKPVVAGTPDLSVVMGDDNLTISAILSGNPDGGAVSTDVRQYTKYCHFKEDSTIPETMYVVNTWHTRKLSSIGLNSLNLALSNSTFTLPVGTYYISGFARSRHGYGSKIAIRNLVNNQIIIDSAGGGSRATAGSMVHLIHGYVTIADPNNTLALQQMLSIRTATSALGVNTTGTTVDSFPKIHSELHIWKVSDNVLT